ncbi:hypothetical protein ACFYY8_03175 [Streptosporangium sp. NPDC001559]|uniref:hypothetical protein n=1 Tax=Streptosporangium sp. NPDC001559 TaxID=3366187 RepID=UPI0036E79D6F
MKRYIAGLACAAMAVVSVPALASTAHAKAADPVAALKSKLVSGQGVTFVDKTKIYAKGQKSAIAADRKGVLQFGPSGVVASDQTGKYRIDEATRKMLEEFSDSDENGEEDPFVRLIRGMAKPERVIHLAKTTYVSGGPLGEFVPEGKSWIRFPHDKIGFPHGTLGAVGEASQSVNAAEPATLKALLGHATTKRAGFYAGKITWGELAKVSPWFRASQGIGLTTNASKTVMSWKLYVGADQLPRRLTTSYTLGAKTTTVYDTVYSGWGSIVSIKTPEPETVAELKDLRLTKPEAQVSILRGQVNAFVDRPGTGTSRNH